MLTGTTQQKYEQNKLFSKHLTINIKKDHHQLSPSKKMAKFPPSDHLDNQDYSYYRRDSSVSIPFIWESQPGTPKVVRFRESSLPPLTPPPSYRHSPVTKRLSQSNLNNKINSNKPSFVKALIFPRKKRASSPSLSPSSSSSSLYYSPVQSPRGRFSSSRTILSEDSRAVGQRRVDLDEEDEENGSPVSTLCFGRISTSSRSRSGCYSSLVKVLLS